MTQTAATNGRSRWLALVVLCAGMLMIILDQTIVNVALPTIQSDLGFSQSSLAWVINAYLIALGGLLLLAGRMGDLLGRRRAFLAGVAPFTFAAPLCRGLAAEEKLVGGASLPGLGLGAAWVVLLAGFVARQATASRPLVPLRIFRSRNVSGANVVQALVVAGLFGMFFMGTLYLQRVLGYDAVQTGAAFLPVSI